ATEEGWPRIWFGAGRARLEQLASTGRSADRGQRQRAPDRQGIGEQIGLRTNSNAVVVDDGLIRIENASEPIDRTVFALKADFLGEVLDADHDAITVGDVEEVEVDVLTACLDRKSTRLNSSHVKIS